MLAAHGTFLAVDSGYSNAKRAAEHNLVLVDGQGWAGEGRYHVYKDLPFESQPRMRDVAIVDGWVHAVAESAAMFDPALGVRRVDRTLVVTPRGRLVLLDRLAADEPREWTFLLHGDWPAEPVDGRWAIRSGSGMAWLTTLTPDLRVEQADTAIEANPTGSTPSLRITKTLRTLRISTARVAEAALLTTLEPTGALAPEPARARAIPDGVDFGDEQVHLPVQGRATLTAGTQVTHL